MSSRSLSREDFMQNPRLKNSSDSLLFFKNYFHIIVAFYLYISYSRWKQSTVGIVSNKNVCMMLMENHSKVLMINVSLYNCPVYWFPWKATVTDPRTDSASNRGRQMGNLKMCIYVIIIYIFLNVAWKDNSNLLLAHRHNSIFNGIANAFSFKGCLHIFSSLITLVHNVP